jgi:hypothetical protein
LSQLYSASHHNRIDTQTLSSCAVWTRPPDGRFYTSIGLSAGSNLSLAKIQKDYGAYDSGIDQELLSVKFSQIQRTPIRFSHEAVNHVVRIEEKSGHRPVRSNAVDVWTLTGARARTWNIELNERAVLIAHETVIYI